jgi:hypothetical protein
MEGAFGRLYRFIPIIALRVHTYCLPHRSAFAHLRSWPECCFRLFGQNAAFEGMYERARWM